MAMRHTAIILVEVELDPISGWGNKPEDFVELTQNALNDRIPHYFPRVKLLARGLRDTSERNGKRPQ